MSIFGGSERFPIEHARSPGPIYAKPDVRDNGQVVMKADYKPVDETQKWGKREGWIGGKQLAQTFVASKESIRAPGYYNENISLIKIRAPQVSFSKSDRFLSQKVSMTDGEHQRERLTAESPGPKYNHHRHLDRLLELNHVKCTCPMSTVLVQASASHGCQLSIAMEF
ncbi:uncharacterized protein PHALS_10859 [Plasmopara halstedii]|uniref:Uncharacterized protein n=1 Tax=Plasmopara halstedii TaxID=4781 RepID=A0A0P1AJH0_PLAHL|nr:uncharacterized protein PHALS_10859 [Plasmopara halstedii]CEG40673.1 hypothetical protein PHALS_10859 [Plasmopara halstedii]|eukprot:XP_024577042.1 hypothetical protein PHALS_10859 [Plasmopara halstedii]